MSEQYYLSVRGAEFWVHLFHLSVPIAPLDFDNFERSDYDDDFRNMDLSRMNPCTLKMVQRLFAEVPSIRGFDLGTHCLGVDTYEDTMWSTDVEETIIAIIQESTGLRPEQMIKTMYDDYRRLFPRHHLTPGLQPCSSASPK